jgi:hypothetical protein
VYLERIFKRMPVDKFAGRKPVETVVRFDGFSPEIPESYQWMLLKSPIKSIALSHNIIHCSYLTG